MKSKTPAAGSPPPPASRLAPVIERAPLPMIEVEGPGHIVRFVNPAFCFLLGRSRDTLIGQPFDGIVCSDPECIDLLDRVYETGQGAIHAAPADAAPADAGPASWLFAMWPALDERNRPERVVIQLTRTPLLRDEMLAINEALLLGSVQQHELRTAAELANETLQLEIAERLRAEARLQVAHAELETSAARLERLVAERTTQLSASMEELEIFAYSLAHDLRAPVRAINNFTEFALEMPVGEVGPAAADMLRRVIKTATRMDSLIQDVLALTQVIQRPISLAPVDLEAIVRSLIQEYPELSTPEAKISVASPLLPVMGHEAMLSQCLGNLLSNAVKFVKSGEKPEIRLWTETRPGEPVPQVRLWVEDEGIGIVPADRDRAFQVFQRLQNSSAYPGSGIGLAIAQKAMQRMGGRIGIEGGPSGGSRFWIELPGVPA